MRRVIQTVAGLAIAGGAIGYKFYAKSSTHDDLKAELVAKCEDDKECRDAVTAHFDACFEDNYDLGGRRRSGGLKQEDFLKCFNEKSGATIFSFKEEEEQKPG